MKRKFVYLVYCNKDPIVYGVYGAKKKALAYAASLVEWRREDAEKKGYKFGRYHEHFEDKRENEYDKHEKTIYSTCLKVEYPNAKRAEWGDDGCQIKVIRRNLS